jgi:hypothetical protein
MELSRMENRSLVVILHAYGPDDLRHIRKSVLAEHPLSHILCPPLPLQMFSTTELTHLALEICLRNRLPNSTSRTTGLGAIRGNCSDRS